MDNIQWYPGHMAKMKRELNEKLNLVDIIIELLDARIPYSSKNPEIDLLSKNKKRIIILNKSDLADNESNKLWEKYYLSKPGFAVIKADSVKGIGISQTYDISRQLMKEKIEAKKKKGVLNVTLRAMVVGIPNVGKSTFINRILGRNHAKAENRPGVTRNKQWIKIKKDFELMDTPGILWPKFEDIGVGINLALTGAIKDQLLDFESLSLKLIEALKTIKPDCLKTRYKIDFEEETSPLDILNSIAEVRGLLLKEGQKNLLRASSILIDEFRSGKLGNISLERPDFESNS